MKIRMLILISLIFSSTSYGASGLYITEGILPYYFKFNNSSVPVTEKLYFSSETGLGYILGDWFYLGGVFNLTLVKEKVGSSGSETTHDETFQFYGPSIGWMGDNRFFVILHYFAYAEHRDQVTNPNGSTSTNARTGTGFGLNVGYTFPMGSFEIAPVLAFKNINYVNCKDPSSGATSTCNPTVTQTELTPYLTLLFNFK